MRLAQREQAIQAIELYGRIASYPFIANLKWFQDVFGRLPEKAAKELPAVEVEAARGRSGSMEVWATVQQWLENTKLPV